MASFPTVTFLDVEPFSTKGFSPDTYTVSPSIIASESVKLSHWVWSITTEMSSTI